MQEAYYRRQGQGGVADVMSNGGRMISLGIMAPNTVSPRSEDPQKFERSRKNEAFRNALDADLQKSAYEQNRKPYVRNFEPGGENQVGLTIGRQLTKTDADKEKLEKQRLYALQLERDRMMQPLPENRKKIQRDGDNEYSALDIGSMEQTQKENARRRAMEILAINKYDAMQKISDPDSLEDYSRQRLRNLPQRDEYSSEVQFSIGQSDAEMREKKERMRREYIANLNSDMNHHSQDPYTSNERKPVRQIRQAEDDYQEGTGLSIGILSTGKSRSQANLESKYTKQQMYKQQLDDQRMQGKEIAQEEEMKYRTLERY